MFYVLDATRSQVIKRIKYTIRFSFYSILFVFLLKLGFYSFFIIQIIKIERMKKKENLGHYLITSLIYLCVLMLEKNNV